MKAEKETEEVMEPTKELLAAIKGHKHRRRNGRAYLAGLALQSANVPLKSRTPADSLDAERDAIARGNEIASQDIDG